MSDTPQTRIARFSELDPGAEDRRVVAGLMHAALPDFYDAIPGDPDSRLALIEAQLDMPETEVGDPLVAVQDDRVVGAVAVYPVAEMGPRQQASLLHVIRSLDRPAQKDFKRAWKASGGGMAPLTDTTGQYIARISVIPAARGSGVAAQMLAHVADGAADQPILLHVDGRNARAIAFYEREGFGFTDTGETDKRAMRRPPG